jgi:hypothetical protein
MASLYRISDDSTLDRMRSQFLMTKLHHQNLTSALVSNVVVGVWSVVIGDLERDFVKVKSDLSTYFLSYDSITYGSF